MQYSYESLARALSVAGIEEAREEAALLLEQFAGATRVALMTERSRLYEDEALEAAVEKRMDRYPLQYILGQWDFFGLPFFVSEACLIPRPDTECLVEEAIRCLPRGAKFADLCTGSGCIAVAILHARPDLTAVALELYPETLDMAVKNAAYNGVADRFVPIRADLLDGGTEALSSIAPFDAILSNPPYIPAKVVLTLSPEVRREPVAALDGGEDGLLFYRAILKDYGKLLKPDGQMLLEIGYDQGEALRALSAAYMPASECRILRDLGGNDRVVHMTHLSL